MNRYFDASWLAGTTVFAIFVAVWLIGCALGHCGIGFLVALELLDVVFDLIN